MMKRKKRSNNEPVKKKWLPSTAIEVPGSKVP